MVANGSEQMGHRRHGHDRHDHGRSGREYRQRRPPADERHVGRHDRGNHVGRDGLHALQRLCHAAHRLAVGPLRAQADGRRERLAVHGRLDVLRQLMLEEGQRKDWFDSSFIVTLAVASGLGLALFVWRELATDRPAVDLRILKSASFSSATALGGVLGMGLYGSLFLLPLFLQNLLGNPAETAGLALMPRSLAMAVVMPIGGLLYNRLGPRLLIAAGLLVSAFSFQELSHLTIAVGFWDVFVPQLWQGVGFSLIFVALSTAALGTIEKAKMTAAAGLYNVVRQVFGSVGIAVAATTLTTGIARYHDSLAEHVTMYDPTTRQWLATATAALRAAGSDAYTASRRALDLLNGDVTRQV